jgi:hypothetical protein
MKPRNKRIQPKHYGLFHGPLRIEVQDVTARHKKGCLHCEELPEGRRLRVVAGGGRSATTSIYCHACGAVWLDDHRTELDRAIDRLDGSHICIRSVQDDD